MPTGEQRRPHPADATALAYDPDFVRTVSVALMDVILGGVPDMPDETATAASANMMRYIVANPAREAERFAVALVTDPDIVAAGESPDFEALTDKIKAVWAVMCGRPE